MISRKTLVVDGYNVINRLPELQSSLDGGLENARDKLAALVSAWRSRHSGYDCVLVFDGSDRFAGAGPQRVLGVRSLFSRDAHGGDEEIIRFVREFAGRPSDITVVSDDNHVRNNSRALGAAVEPASFLAARKPRRPRVKAEAGAGGRGLDNKAAAEIDKELRKKFGL